MINRRPLSGTPKATETLKKSGTAYVFDLDIRDYHLWQIEPMPVFLVLFDAARRRAYWLYVQRFSRKFVAPTKEGCKNGAGSRSEGSGSWPTGHPADARSQTRGVGATGGEGGSMSGRADGRLDQVLRSLGFAVQVVEDRTRVYKNAETGALIACRCSQKARKCYPITFSRFGRSCKRTVWPIRRTSTSNFRRQVKGAK